MSKRSSAEGISTSVANQLPTFTSAKWTITSLRDSLIAELGADTQCATLRFFAYAITQSGWSELSSSVQAWLRAKGRAAIAYIGTDHALTDPDAVRAMSADGVQVRVMRTYQGVYHPKVTWLSGDSVHVVWIGSNNLTRDGLMYNIEFATLIKSDQESTDLGEWFRNIHDASEVFGNDLLKSYEVERRAYGKRRCSIGTFTWSKRQETSAVPTEKKTRRPATKQAGVKPASSSVRMLRPKQGDLIVEVMPLETGSDGKQMQLPVSAAGTFFGLSGEPGASRRISLKAIGASDVRPLTMTIFKNHTTRLSLYQLDYRDRPCVILFRKVSSSTYQFEIIQKSIFPDRYRALVGKCGNKTREGARRWTII